MRRRRRNSPPPQVIFLDAVGTLFGVRGSVGQIYCDVAEQFGVTADARAVDDAFFQSFKAAPPMAFPNVDVTEIPGREFAWWRAIAVQTFQQVQVFDHFTDFSAFFDALYAYFATAKPWFLYSDITTALPYWKDRDIQLGIISNFDSRLYQVLEALDLGQYFESVTISTEIGAAKPNPKLFLAALQKHDCPPEAAWHIGDSFKEDYEGANAAGIRGIWLNRAD